MHCSCIVRLVNVWYEPALHGWVVGTEVPAGQKYLRRKEEERGGIEEGERRKEEGERRERGGREEREDTCAPL